VTGITTGSASRDSGEIDALVTDRYLESLLAAHARGASSGPVLAAAWPAAEIGATADRLARDLPRLHPSFRFEEALAARLGEAAARLRFPLAAGLEDTIVPLPVRGPGLGAGAAFDEWIDPIRLRWDSRQPIGRPLLIGGALTSAALSLAGAAYVAWRFRRAPGSPMARAVRAVARARLA
jgi:hypothetical protein